jgi:hypothetical protein
MDIAQLLIGAFIGGAAGALGYGVARLVQGYMGLRRTPYWLVAACAVLGIVGGTALLGDRAPAWLPWSEVQVAVDDVLPYMKLIKERDAALYERIETSVIRDQEDGISAPQVRANAAALVSSYVADKAMSLPDNLTYELFAATRDQMAYLMERRDFEACADLALGRSNAGVERKLSSELLEQRANTTMRVIATPAAVEAPRMPAEEFRLLTSQAFAQASQMTGIAPDEIDALLAGSGDAAKTCRLMKAFFDAILAQPVDVAAATLRTMVEGERSPLN